MKAEATEYLQAIGLTDGEIADLAANLANSPYNPETYVVVAGDTLWGIAARLLGSGAKWSAIYEANKSIIANPNMIYIGQTLVLP